MLQKGECEGEEKYIQNTKQGMIWSEDDQVDTPCSEVLLKPVDYL